MIAYIITGVICFALGGVFGVFAMALLAAEKRNTYEPEYKPIIKLQPSEAEVRMAARATVELWKLKCLWIGAAI